MRVGHKLVLDLIQMLVELTQIQTNSLVEHCPERKAEKMKTVGKKQIRRALIGTLDIAKLFREQVL